MAVYPLAVWQARKALVDTLTDEQHALLAAYDAAWRDVIKAMNERAAKARGIPFEGEVT